MKLMFLGTAAAEGVPAVFCNCPTCKRAKQAGGKEIRTRSQILIDGDILFDFPMDTYLHMLKYKLDLSAVKHVLITHAHMDHCYPQEFCMRGEPFARDMTEKAVSVYCNSTVLDLFVEDTSREMRTEIACGIKLNALKPYDEKIEDGLRFIALPAAHTKGEDCLVYYVERNNKGALLLNDTGVLSEDVYKKLVDMGGSVDIAALDCTYGARRHGAGRHMGLYDIADQTEIMRSVGVLKQNAKIIATHFSHNADLDYSSMQKEADRYGIIVAYDGMEITV